MIGRVSSRVPEGLLYALTVFGPLAFGCVEPWSRAVLEVLAFALALTAFLGGPRRLSRGAAWFWLVPLAFAALGLLQLARFAPADGPRPLAPSTVAPHETAGAVLLWLAYAAVAFGAPRALLTHEAARRYARVLFGVGLFVAVVGLLQKVAGGHKLYFVRSAAGTGDFGPYYNRDHAANLLLMALALGLGAATARVRRAAGSLDAQVRAALPWLGGALVILVAFLAADSRGALIAVPLACAALVFLGADFETAPRRRLALGAGALLGAAAVVFLAFRYVGSAADAGGLVDESVMGRFFIYGDAARWLRDAPLFGTGLGSFETVYPSYQDLSLHEIVQHAHSGWLELALEGGAAGLALELLGAALAAAAGFRAWRRARSAEMRGLIAGAMGAAAAFCAHALCEFCFQIPGNAAVFMGVTGFLLSAPAWGDKAGGREKPPARPAWQALPASAAALLLAFWCLRPATAAVVAGTDGDAAERQAALERALELDWSPHFMKALSSLWYRKAEAAARPDPAALRLSLAYSLEASWLRPYDADALYLAGAALWRLRREDDGRALVDDSGRIRFSPITRVESDDAEARREKRRAALRALGVLPEERPR